MSTKRVAVTTMFLIVSWLANDLTAQKPIPANCDERIFSDVRHITEADDYVGTEVMLKICRGEDQVVGEWREYEGYHPAVTPLAGRLVNQRLQLRGSNVEGNVELTGQQSEDRLRGTLVWHIGKSRQLKTLNLPRMRCPVRPPQ